MNSLLRNYLYLRLKIVSLLGCEVEHTIEVPNGEKERAREICIRRFQRKNETAVNDLKTSQAVIKEIFLK